MPSAEAHAGLAAAARLRLAPLTARAGTPPADDAPMAGRALDALLARLIRLDLRSPLSGCAPAPAAFWRGGAGRTRRARRRLLRRIGQKISGKPNAQAFELQQSA